MEYIHHMDNDDMTDVAPPCITVCIFEETLALYCKYNYFDAALDVLLDHIGDLGRALEFAVHPDRVHVW